MGDAWNLPALGAASRSRAEMSTPCRAKLRDRWAADGHSDRMEPNRCRSDGGLNPFWLARRHNSAACTVRVNPAGGGAAAHRATIAAAARTVTGRTAAGGDPPKAAGVEARSAIAGTKVNVAAAMSVGPRGAATPTIATIDPGRAVEMAGTDATDETDATDAMEDGWRGSHARPDERRQAAVGRTASRRSRPT
eukprot:scaffold293_cov248-Pinguiococcus_pyrenoidosus.AAC.3